MINRQLEIGNARVMRGQSLFEVIFALGIAAIILLAMASLASSTLRNTTFSTDNATSTQLAQEATEWLRNERDTQWDTFAARGSSAGRVWCLTSLTWPSASGVCSGPVTGTLYTRSVILKSVDAYPTTPDGIIDTINAEITVSWNDSKGTHTIKNNASYTDWRK